MLQHKAIIEFGIIGLGRFGFSLAKTLADAGKEVLVIDNNEDKESLEDAGIQNCGTVIVCIGEKVDVSILTTLNVISMGVPRVIAKAFSYEQGLILEKIGAEVIYPENDMAIRLANRLISSSTVESIELKGGINISEMKLSNKIAGETVLESNLRQRFKLNIIAIEHEGDTITDITPDYVLREDDKVVVVGKKEDLKKFESFLRGLR